MMSPTAPSRRTNGLLPLFVIFGSLNAILITTAIASILLDIETFAIIRTVEEGSDAPKLDSCDILDSETYLTL